MNIPFLSLADATAPYADELKKAAIRVIDSGRFLGGEETRSFEEEMSALHSGLHCVGVSNGLDSLRLIVRGFIELGRLTPGDKVIVPGGTYIASLMPLTEFGLIPIFIDSDPSTLNMNVGLAAYAAKTARVLMTVHLYGTPCWSNEFLTLAQDKGLIIIEDNAQSIGAYAECEGMNNSRITGTLGHAAGFSFYPTKNIGALGDAGAVITADKELSDTVRTLANYGADRRYHNIYEGYNCRIDEIQAAFLRVKLCHLESEISRRCEIAAIYDRNISNPLIIKPTIDHTMRQVWHQYIIRTERRDDLRKYLKAAGIGTDVHYEISPTRQPCYRRFASTPLPQTDMLCATMVSLPIGSATKEDALRVAETINSFG